MKEYFVDAVLYDENDLTIGWCNIKIRDISFDLMEIKEELKKSFLSNKPALNIDINDIRIKNVCVL